MSSFEFRAGEDVPHAVRRIVRHQIDSLRAELRRAPRRERPIARLLARDGGGR